MPMQAQRGGGSTAPTHPNLGTGRGELSAPRPARFTHGKYPVPNVQEAVWASGPIPKMSPPPPGFNPRTVQPVASRYIDYDVLEFIQNRV
jgi:hypothetical protein